MNIYCMAKVMMIKDHLSEQIFILTNKGWEWKCSKNSEYFTKRIKDPIFQVDRIFDYHKTNCYVEGDLDGPLLYR